MVTFPYCSYKMSFSLDLALQQLAATLRRLGHHFPADTSEQQHYLPRQVQGAALGANVGWTTGFWTGMMWLAYELSGQPQFEQAARTQTASFAQRLQAERDLDHHDLGFLYLLSHVAADQLCALPAARSTALAAADRLLARFLPGAGVIQAWGKLDDPQEHGRTIIDCLMNLPLLHWAARVSGEHRYTDVARIHTLRTREHLVRANGASYHTYFFDTVRGTPLRPSTHQGWSDQSCWARGQAWALYGFALNHRHLPDLGLLDTACLIADYFLARLPPDRIALWDLSLPLDSNEPRDSSACAIAACGLFDLAAQLPAGPRQQHYRQAAIDLLGALQNLCAARLPQAGGLLLHGTYHRQIGLGVDECTLWGDYYYLEALARWQRGWRSYDSRLLREPASAQAESPQQTVPAACAS